MLISNDLMWKINVGDLSIVDENAVSRHKECKNQYGIRKCTTLSRPNMI